MNVKKTKKFKENHPENYHVHDKTWVSVPVHSARSSSLTFNTWERQQIPKHVKIEENPPTREFVTSRKHRRRFSQDSRSPVLR